MGDYSGQLAHMQQMLADQQKQALMQQLSSMSNQVGGLLAGSQFQQGQILGGNQFPYNQGIPNGISAATAYAQDVTAFYDYNKAAFVVKAKATPESKPKKLSNLEWLDQRVNEMRVRL